jgi:Kef-type K+ transport system membrane component KefB
MKWAGAILVNALLVVVIGGLMHATRSFAPESGGASSASTALALGCVMLMAFFVGKLSSAIRLPRLTGYLVTGLVIGPSVLGFLTEDSVVDLKLVNGVAISLIALTAGGELNFRAMRSLMKSIISITTIGTLAAVAALTGVIFVLQGLLPFMKSLTLAQSLAVCFALGIALSAMSPAVAVALRNELNAEGPVSRTVLGVVVLNNMAAILLFALASALINILIPSGEGGGTAARVAWELVGSLGIGFIIGAILSLFLAKIRDGIELIVLLLCVVIAEVGSRVQLDPLLVALAAGVFIQNLTKSGERLIKAIEEASLPVYVLFFAVAGATIHINVLMVVGIPVAILVLVRSASLIAGSSIATRIAGAPPSVARYGGFGLLPQAGLALAIAMIIARAFPGFGEGASALIFGVVGVNEILMPVLYRWALVRSGEGGDEEARQAPPPAVEPAPPPAPAGT